MFAIGDKVVYPVHGAGIIEAIENREVLGVERSYYILRIFSGNMRMLVPVDSVDGAGLRSIISQKEIGKVLDIFRGKAEACEENWNRRYRLNMDKIKSGSAFNVASVVHNLMLRDRERTLSAGEKKMMENAKRILVSELALAGDYTEEKVLSMIADILDESAF